MRGPCSWERRRAGFGVTHAKQQHALLLEFTHSLTPVLPALLSRTRALFDLDARPDVIAKRLRQRRAPGGGGQGEPGPARAGRLQRVRTGAARDSRAAGDGEGGDHHRRAVRRTRSAKPIVTPMPELNRLTPARGADRGASVGDIARHGIVAARARSIIALAEAQGSGGLCLDGGSASQSGRRHQAAGGAAGDRPVDGALHRDARAAMARCLSEGGHRRAQESRAA